MKKTRNRIPACAAAILLASCLSSLTWAQPAGPDASVPRAVNYSGVAKDESGKPLSGVVGAVFAVYAEQSGGAPVWMETQNVTVAAGGKFSVVLGATQSAGIPMEVFGSSQGRWLGVSYNGGAEQPRVALLSVPYALKAGDAQTIGGLPPSAFVLAAPAAGDGPTAGPRANDSAPAPAAQPAAGSNVTTNGGTAGTLPLWTTATNIQSSALTQTGSGAAAKIGIGNTTPAATLDVKGTSIVRGALTLPATGAATAGAGADSQPQKLVASAFNSSAATAVPQTFQWQAEPAHNDTSNASGTLNLLFGSGNAAPAETGLKISNQGLFTFASGQSFPGAGTITGVTTSAGSGLMGGGSSGSLSLGLLNTCGASQVLQWNGSQWGCGSAGVGTITGVTAGTDLSGGGSSGNITLSLNTSATDARYAQLGAANTFNANQSINGTLTSTGVTSGVGFFTTSGGVAAIQATQSASTGSGAIVGISHSTQTGTPAILGSALAASGQGQVFGVQGSVQSSSSAGVYGVDGSRSSIGSNNAGKGGVWGDAGTVGEAGVTATADNAYGVVAINDSAPFVAVEGINASGSGQATGIYGASDSPTGTGILGQSSFESGTYQDVAGVFPVGVNGDTGAAGGIGVLGTADSGYAVYGVNNGSYVTGLFINQSSSLSYGLEAGSFNQNCTIDTAGDLQCTGTTAAVVQLSDQRWVRLYGVQSAENWFEDFGSGQLSDGGTVITLDPTFTQTVSSSSDYHVFLTPNGDSRGLYVTAKTPTSFAVREQGGGTSSVAFDYRIVAKRKGYEDVRLADVTDSQNRLMTDTRRVAEHDASQVKRVTTKALSPVVAQQH